MSSMESIFSLSYGASDEDEVGSTRNESCLFSPSFLRSSRFSSSPLALCPDSVLPSMYIEPRKSTDQFDQNLRSISSYPSAFSCNLSRTPSSISTTGSGFSHTSSVVPSSYRAPATARATLHLPSNHYTICHSLKSGTASFALCPDSTHSYCSEPKWIQQAALPAQAQT